MNKIVKISVFLFFTSILLEAALPANFVVGKFTKTRANIKTVRLEASTIIFNDEDPESNIEFNETILLNDVSKSIFSVKIDKSKIRKYSLNKMIKINLHDKEYFAERGYLTLKVQHKLSDTMHLLFSRRESEIRSIMKNSEIDTDTIGLGRLSGAVCRIYGAKEINTYRKEVPTILDKVKRTGLFEDTSMLLRIKPQLWFSKDTFFIHRFISKKDIFVPNKKKQKKVISDVQFKNYRVFGSSYMYPKIIDVYHNERLYARTVIKNMTFNPKLKKSLFSLKTGLKKRTLNKMIEKLSDEGLQILWFLRQYR